jgi:p70 ribosomal S6 kinase
VYQVRQRNRNDPSSKTGRIFAMKCMRKESVLQDNLKGTKNERSVLSKLRHPFIVTMHFAFQCKGRLYLIMDYFPGGQFLDMLHKNSPFTSEAVKVYTAEVMLALKELHANGIVHRDLKPENILVDAQGHLVVTDFGCSKVHESRGESGTMAIRSNSWLYFFFLQSARVAWREWNYCYTLEFLVI